MKSDELLFSFTVADLSISCSHVSSSSTISMLGNKSTGEPPSMKSILVCVKLTVGLCLLTVDNVSCTLAELDLGRTNIQEHIISTIVQTPGSAQLCNYTFCMASDHVTHLFPLITFTLSRLLRGHVNPDMLNITDRSKSSYSGISASPSITTLSAMIVTCA